MNQDVGQVYLVEVEIEQVVKFSDQITIKKNQGTKREGLSYRFPQTFMQPAENICIVCPPTYALFEVDTETDNNNQIFNGKGYIKAIPKEKQNSIVAQQSGMRSAILQWNGKQYRLKGCGNGSEGFTTRKFEGDIDGLKEIRGCCFEHTVRRELFMCKQIERIMQKYNIDVGNKSVGYWQYGNIESVNEHLVQPLSNCVKLIPKYCGIYETLGDCRLGTHLLQGLRMIVDEHLRTWTIDMIKELITVESRIDVKRKSFHGNAWDLNNTQYRERPEGTILQEDDYIQDRVFDWEKEKENISITENLTNDSVLQNISILYQRLGYEVGRVKRIMIDHDINWGYFRDHSKFYYHSNAHLDNFVVLQNGSTLLAPVDFDLSFFKNEFINIDYDFDAMMKNSQAREENPKYGKFDLEQWLFYLDQERIGLELAIAGVDMILASQMFVSQVIGDVQEFFEILLRDQMRIGYLNGFMLKDDSSLFCKRINKIQSLISTALGLTRHIIA